MVREGLLKQAQGWEMIEAACKASGVAELPGIMRGLAGQVGQVPVKTEVKVEAGAEAEAGVEAGVSVKAEPGVVYTPVRVKVWYCRTCRTSMPFTQCKVMYSIVEVVELLCKQFS
jgi:hypothetical protein